MSNPTLPTLDSVREWIRTYVRPGKDKASATRIAVRYYDDCNTLYGRGFADVPYSALVGRSMSAEGYSRSGGQYRVEFLGPGEG